MSEEQQTNSINGDNQEPIGKEAAPGKELAELKAKSEANLAGWQRAQADFANYKKRSEQEKEEIVKFSSSALILRILPVLDDFERAVGSLPEDLRSHPWVDGVKHIERKLRSTLETQGLSPIKAVGEPFDPRVHEAVRQDNGPEDIIIDEAVKGYKFLDRIIRPSQVVVGNGESVKNEDIKKDAGTE
jgi:molecular chaperone GrpE